MKPERRRFHLNGSGWFALCFVALLVVVAVTGPALVGDPAAISRDVLQPPGSSHILGTDHLGRDVFARMVIGTRVSLVVGVLAAAMAMLIGVTLGAVSGFVGGKTDLVLMRIAEMFQALPTLVVAIAFVALLGASLTNIVVVIAILSWAQIARVTRAEVLRIRNQDFVNAVRALGFRESTILFREIIPNAIPAVLPLIALGVAEAILQESSISFLGLGSPDTITWGLLIREGNQQILRAWWMIVFPGIAVFLTILAFNLLGDAVGRALNPKTRTEEPALAPELIAVKGGGS